MCSVKCEFTLKKGAMPIPELTSGCIIGDLVVLYIFTPEVAHEDTEEEVKKLPSGTPLECQSFNNILTCLTTCFTLA